MDRGCRTAYFCENYQSITKGPFRDDMTALVSREIELGKVRQVLDRPRCVHSLGGVEKSDHTLRPITDCSRPEGININLYMDETCAKFHYKTVDDAVNMINPNDYCSVTDISSAYRSLNVLPSHRTYQGFSWGDGRPVATGGRGGLSPPWKNLSPPRLPALTFYRCRY